MIAIFQSYAYEAIFAAVLLDTIGLPVPGEVVLLAAGMARRPRASSSPRIRTQNGRVPRGSRRPVSTAEWGWAKGTRPKIAVLAAP